MSPIWPTQQTNANAAMLAAWGVPATFIPQDGSGSQPITVVEMKPAMNEDYPPAFGPGPAVLRLWCWFETITPSPTHGDQIGFGSAVYLVQEVEADQDGAAVLKLRTT